MLRLLGVEYGPLCRCVNESEAMLHEEDESLDLTPLWICVGRRDDYAIQQPSGRYWRQFRQLVPTVLSDHLAGRKTIGAYVLCEMGTCSFAVFDADQADGMCTLRDFQTTLGGLGYPAYLERSRRGGHLWIFFADPARAEVVRVWLWPRNQRFPKQVGGQGIGSLIRLPPGIHRRSEDELVPPNST